MAGVVLAGLVACAGEGDEVGSAETSAEADPAAVVTTTSDSDAPVRPDRIEGELTRGDTVSGHPSWTHEDLEVLQSTVDWARDAGIDTLPVGERMARIGERFVGAPYIPQTLDPPGPERLVVNLRAFDCVTFVETVLTLAHVVTLPDAILSDTDALMTSYGGILTTVRYRGGTLEGYPSRLHYFSEWMDDAAEKALVEVVTAELGGVLDEEPITFMTSHRDAYHQLEDPDVFEVIAEIEAGLPGARYVLPEDRVREAEDRIRSGDIIAATSTLEGLDVAHTGIALRRDGVLRLMHAPLVGEAVQISEASIGARLLNLSAQDGIMVARPVEREF